MKTYKNYVFETVSNPDFNSDFEVIIDKIDEFWSILDNALDKLEEYCNQNSKDVASANANIVSKKPIAPVAPVSGETYNYITKGNAHEVVVIVEPNAQHNNPSALPNTAIVKTITPPSNIPHTADWSRLIPTKQPVPAP